MTAREVLLDEKADLSALAKAKNLSETLLKRWVDSLKTAKENASHPLHSFALVALDKKSDDAAEFSQRLAPLVEGWKKQKTEIQSAPLIAPESVVADYTQ